MTSNSAPTHAADMGTVCWATVPATQATSETTAPFSHVPTLALEMVSVKCRPTNANASEHTAEPTARSSTAQATALGTGCVTVQKVSVPALMAGRETTVVDTLALTVAQAMATVMRRQDCADVTIGMMERAVRIAFV